MAFIGRRKLLPLSHSFRRSCDHFLVVDGLFQSLSLQYLLASQRPLQARLHLHLTEFLDGEVYMIQCALLLVWEVIQEQLSELQTGESELRCRS